MNNNQNSYLYFKNGKPKKKYCVCLSAEKRNELKKIYGYDIIQCAGLECPFYAIGCGREKLNEMAMAKARWGIDEQHFNLARKSAFWKIKEIRHVIPRNSYFEKRWLFVFRTTKLKKAIVLTGIKKNVLCDKCNTTYRQLNYLIESERHKKPQLDTVANAIGLEFISQFRIGNQIITAPTFAEMIKELLLIKEIPQTAIVAGTKQNASSKINNGKFSYDELQDIARKCGAIYDERYILNGMEL